MKGLAHGIGMKIRSLRKQKGMTLGGLARLCRCSSSLLSQIERGIVNPSLSTLKTIGDAFGVSLAQIITDAAMDERPSHALMKEKERKMLTTEGGVQFQLLSRDIHVPFEFILNLWPPRSSTGKQSYAHQGEECGLLLEGELEVEVDGKVYRMKPGDTVTLRSSTSHRISNPGKKKALAVWVNLPPWVFSNQ